MPPLKIELTEEYTVELRAARERAEAEYMMALRRASVARVLRQSAAMMVRQAQQRQAAASVTCDKAEEALAEARDLFEAAVLADERPDA